ncbi:thioredoxin family protein [Aureibacter tunicatorum]|uniref:Thioredoxin-related protein n=1 Tax=Aureibacter tunicatorum TaxID=866807 RepID=A0AAE3XJW9_9BACT|nr:thioredoxin fold domain-containing protein [Aureibacter tunicatorum]MDR6237300.1 thioredoxin-related protein [Aureibacter tunicatorum]
MKNKAIIFFAAACLLTVNLVWALSNDSKDEGKVKWHSITEVEKLSKDDPRPILVKVYTDWCGWCKKMDKDTFDDSTVADYINENYYAVKLNAESTTPFKFKGESLTPKAFAQKYGVRGFPTTIFFGKNFTSPNVIPGYQDAKKFQKTLESNK